MGPNQICSLSHRQVSNSYQEYIDPYAALQSVLYFHLLSTVPYTLSFPFTLFLFHFPFEAPVAISILTSITMYYSASTIALVAFAANVHAHGVILAAVGDSGQSQGFLGTFT